MSRRSDRELGMDREITRRDFVNGVGVAITGSLVSPSWLACLGVTEFAPEKAGYLYMSILFQEMI